MSGMKNSQRLLWLGVVIATIVLTDQLTKRWMVEWIGPGSESGRVELLGSWFAFEYLENRGAAFGMFQQGTMTLAIVSVVIIVIGLIALVRFAAGELLLAVFIAVILGGAIGNAIDRFVRGYVVDFIAVGRFWKFNLADSAVTIGVLATFVLLWRIDARETGASHIQEYES